MESIDQQIIKYGESRQLDELQMILKETTAKETILLAKIGRSDCCRFWNYLLLGLEHTDYEMREKRFACVKILLEHLLKIELSYKQTFDLNIRLCQELPTFPDNELVEIYEHCLDGIRLGDPKCVGWKDLLPETIKVLRNMPEVLVNGLTMTGEAFRNNIVNNLCTMRWPVAVLTPIANMFRELELSNAEMDLILRKFGGLFDTLAPMELPALCFQIFSLCKTAAQIIVPLIALERYFHRYLYKKLFADMNSNSTDFDSIDKFSDRELREAEETILHHLNYCTQYQITELQMCTVLRNFQAMPDNILTPFMLSAIISMTAANREPDITRLSASVILSFLRSVIKNNEDEHALSEHSIWCRETLIRKEVDLKQIFRVLIDQNKEGKDVITPGLVNLAFVLLKTRNNRILNNLAINFLVQFVRKRFVFGQGVVGKIANWMVLEPDQYQFSECLVQLSVADTFTVSECIKTINYVMDFFLFVPGEQAMYMMSFILPILKISPMVRDAFIEILRKAMKSTEAKTCRMAIYGFCMILKQLNNSNSQRSQSTNSSSFCTQQHSISGYSLMSQMTLGNRSNPQRHFDMLTLEIIGVLRNCFGQTVDIRTTLYENLQRAVELNSKLTPHVLQFIDWHFRSFFVATPAVANANDVDNVEMDEELEFDIKFDKIVQSKDLEQREILIMDNLGKLILFISHCLEIFEKIETDYDTREMKRLLQMSIDKTLSKDLKFEELKGSLTHFKQAVCVQQINFIEGLIAYLILNSKQTNDNVKCLVQLFKEQQKLIEKLKKSAANTKKSQKKSNKNETETMVNITINGEVVEKIESKIENIWDLEVVDKFLRLLHEDIVPFASPAHTTALRSNVELVRYVLEVTMVKVEAIALAPEYKQLSHSKRTLKYLTDITKVIYERCIKRLAALWRDFDMETAILAAECFQKCLQTANKVYKKSFVTLFVKGFDILSHQHPRELPTTLHTIVDEYMKEHEEDHSSDVSKATEIERLPAALMLSLEVLYENMKYDDSMTTESYTWLLKFCHENVVQTRQLSIVHKLLFSQRLKTHAGEFFVHIVRQFARVVGLIDDNGDLEFEANTQNIDLKAINWQSLPYCYQYLYDALRKQIDDVEYFIVKANNALYKLRIVSDLERDVCLSTLRSLQRAICTQLDHLAKTLYEFANVRSSLGVCMDGLLRLLTQYYICLKNLAKHFLSCTPKVTLQGSRFDLLLKDMGKCLPKRIYALITYIDANIIDNGDAQKTQQTTQVKRKKINPKAAKEKVLREAKPITKLIHCMEDFNKHVILLAKKANNERLAHFMHLGVVRDFRLQNKELKRAIERTLSHSSSISQSTATRSEQDDDEYETGTLEDDENAANVNETPPSNFGSQNNSEAATLNQVDNASSEEEIDDNDDDNDGDSVTTASTSRRGNPKASTAGSNLRSASSRCLQRLIDDVADEDSSTGSNTPTPDGETLQDSEVNSRSQLMRNLKKINRKAKKRAIEESEQSNIDPDVAVAAVVPPKRRKGRSAKQ